MNPPCPSPPTTRRQHNPQRPCRLKLPSPANMLPLSVSVIISSFTVSNVYH